MSASIGYQRQAEANHGLKGPCATYLSDENPAVIRSHLASMVTIDYEDRRQKVRHDEGYDVDFKKRGSRDL